MVATSGALQNLKSYLNGPLLDNINSTFQGYNDYISETLGIPPVVVYSSLAALVAVPVTMSRYGWSRSGGVSPYGFMSSGAPKLTDEDFSYITKQDLEDHNMGAPIRGRYEQRHENEVETPSEDDILTIRNKGKAYKANFPAFSIGDGKLQVHDIKERIGLLMGLPDRTVRKIKLLYKGRHLEEPLLPVRDYGVKNKSEVMAVVPDGHWDDASDAENHHADETRADGKSKRKRKKRSGKKTDGKADEGDSASNSNHDGSRSPPGGNGAMKILDDLSTEFTKNWRPLCRDFISKPPRERKKRDDEHRKLSESVLQHVLLKLDGVETDGNPDIRARRKQLVREVQDILKELDITKAS